MDTDMNKINDKNNDENDTKKKSKTDNTNIIRFRADDEMIKLISDLAEKHKLDRSKVIREIINGDIERIASCTHYATYQQGSEIKRALMLLSNKMSLYKTDLAKIEKQIARIGQNYNQEIKYRNENNLPQLPLDEINKQIEKVKETQEHCREVFEEYGEVLACLIPE